MRTDLVYVVHSEPGLAAQLSHALLSSDFKVVSMTSEKDADAALSGQQFVLPDAILTPLGDIESGDSILIRLFESNPLMEQIPLVVVASSDKDERRRALRLGLLSVVFPPYDREEVALTTQLAIEKHRNEQLLFGSLSQLSVPDLLQTAEVGRRSGTISFQNDGSKGQVWLRDGLIINAHIDDATPPLKAVYEMVLWDSGTFEANFGTVDSEEKFALPPSEVVLEAMRRLDESRIAEIPGPDPSGEIDLDRARLELALTLLNVTSSYTGNYLEAKLLVNRLEEVRREVLESAPEADLFRVTAGGPIVIERDVDDAERCLRTAARWCGAFFERMDGALAWRFDRKRLAHILNPWKEMLEAEGLLEVFGVKEVADLGPDDDDSRLLASKERPLPLGRFLLDSRGTIRQYSPYGPQMGRVDDQRVTGQMLTAVVPAAIAGGAVELFDDLARGAQDQQCTTARFDFEMGHLPVSVRLVFLRSPVEGNVILTINRVRSPEQSLSTLIERDPLLGTLSDGAGHRLLAVNEDFLCAFEGTLARALRHRHQELLQRFGKQWGLRHALRVEQVVQRQYEMTLREVESHVAFELLSASTGILGLGNFEVDLSFGDTGVIVVTHSSSPFPSYFTSPSEVVCSILAGFHAAILSYLAGRNLAAREVCCSRSPGEPCLFVVATEDRLNKLFIATPGSSDHALLAGIAARRGHGGGS